MENADILGSIFFAPRARRILKTEQSFILLHKKAVQWQYNDNVTNAEKAYHGTIKAREWYNLKTVYA